VQKSKGYEDGLGYNFVVMGMGQSAVQIIKMCACAVFSEYVSC